MSPSATETEDHEGTPASVSSASLLRRIRSSFSWIVGMRATHQLAQVVRTVFLARLLSPDDFGLFGIGLLILTIVNAVSNPGFRSAVVHYRDVRVSEVLGVLWSVSLLRGLLLAALICTTSGVAASFFSEPDVELVVRALAAVPLIGSLENPAIVELRRDVRLKGTVLPRMASSIVNLGVALPVAAVTGSVWALVWGFVAGKTAAVAASYWVRPWRPRLEFDGQVFRKLFSYGKWLTGGSILHLIYNNGDDLAVGKLLGSDELGLYRLAYSISNMPADYVTRLVGQVAFPTFSELQHQPEQLREAYERTLLLVSSLSIPMAVGIFLMAPEVVEHVLGAKWLPMVPALRLLAAWGLIRSLGANSGPLYRAVGRPDIGTKIQFAKVITLVPMLVAAFVYGGLTAVAVAVTLNALLVDPWNFSIQFRLSGSSLGRVVRRLTPVVLATVAMGALVVVVKILRWATGTLGTGLVVAGAGLVYFVLLAACDHWLGRRIRSSILRIVSA